MSYVEKNNFIFLQNVVKNESTKNKHYLKGVNDCYIMVGIIPYASIAISHWYIRSARVNLLILYRLL